MFGPCSHGITIRSLSKYLALCYESVEVRWRRAEPGRLADGDTYNMVLLPWPLSVRADDFRPAPPSLLENMDLEHFGFFEFEPESLSSSTGCWAPCWRQQPL